MSAVSIRPKGGDFVRAAIFLMRAQGRPAQAAADAEAAFGPTSPAALITRSVVSTGTTFDANFAAPLAPYRSASSDFIEALRPMTVLGRMTGFRRVPLHSKIPRFTAGSDVGWVGQGSLIAVSSLALDTVTLDLFKLGGIVVLTEETIRYSAPGAEDAVRADMLVATAKFSDQALLDPAQAGEAGVSPASITNGATTIVSSGSTALQIAADLRLLFDVLADAGINFLAPYLICSSRTAIALSLKMDTAGAPAFPVVTAKGGVLAGVPLLVSSSLENSGDSPLGSVIVLIDAAELLVAEDPGSTLIDASAETTVQLNTAPDSPILATTSFVSLWQMGLVGVNIVRHINWQLRRPGAVAVMSGVNY